MVSAECRGHCSETPISSNEVWMERSDCRAWCGKCTYDDSADDDPATPKGFDTAENSVDNTGHWVCSGKELQWLLGRVLADDEDGDGDEDGVCLEKGLAREGTRPLHLLGTPSLGYIVLAVVVWSTSPSTPTPLTTPPSSSTKFTSCLEPLAVAETTRATRSRAERYLDIVCCLLYEGFPSNIK